MLLMNEIQKRSARRALVAIASTIALVWFAAVQGTLAQVPLPDRAKEGKQSQRLTAPAPLDLAKQRASIEEKLGPLRARLERGDGLVAAAPAGVSAEEAESARTASAALVQIYQGQLVSLAQIERLRKARETAELAEKSWSGFSEKPPYSMILLDDVRQKVKDYRATLELRASARELLATQSERFLERSRAAQEAVRLATERREREAPGSTAHAIASWRLSAAQAEATVAEAIFAVSKLSLVEHDERLAISRAILRLEERRLAALSGNASISRRDVEEVRSRLEAARAERAKQLASVSAAVVRNLRERDQARRAVEDLQAGKSAAKGEAQYEIRLRIAEARLRAAESWVHSLELQSRVLTVFTTLYHTMMVNAWERRFEVLTSDDADIRQRARKQIEETLKYLRSWEQIGRVQLSDAQENLREQDKRTQYTTVPALEKYEQNALNALRQLESLLDMQQTVLAARISQLGEWSRDFDQALRHRSSDEIAREVWARIKVVATSFWNYELLTIVDTVELGGEKVTTTRGVTVGKSIGAILVFLIGYWLIRFLSLRLERLLVSRFTFGEQQSRTVRRWANALGLVLVLMVTLNLARIPVAVFAFAGGALAIGIGFGTQTLIKNLISGMILLLERQIKVGDIVEVEGVTGTVTEVNIRSSTVRGFDGVESLLPNSMLLEQKVTNWTLSNKQVRRIVKVGVAYGSPARQVAEVLADCAGRHGLVLKDPSPRVIFEDFGDNALVFALYFWVELKADTSSLQVMSDLRFMIEKQLGEAGVVIAYPQRDVHLDSAAPLRVALVREPEVSPEGRV